LGDLQALDARSAKERIALAVDVSLYPDSSLRDRAGRLGQSKSAVGRGLFELVRKGYAMESPNGHELSPKGKKWIAGQ
jgi:predicted transcriptional regulator